MTEAQWLVCADPAPLLRFIGRRGSDRKFRLFQVACCRRIWDLIPDTRWREAVGVAEQYADGEVGDKRRSTTRTLIERPMGLDSQMERMAVQAATLANNKAMGRGLIFLGVGTVFGFAARQARGIIDTRPCRVEDLPAYQHEQAVEAELLRDTFGNPFRPVVFSPSWLTDTAVALARQMYESRDFSAMPILADALQDAGCASAEILDHCRGPGPHVRGCWVVDLVLGKE
jgi:hypothetical protein